MEAFCSEHTVGIDTVLYDWPASKFEALYEAYAKRKIAEELSQRRALEIAALWGNSNYDNSEHPEIRQNLMQQVDEQYSSALQALYEGTIDNGEEEIDWDDPFFAASKRGIEKRKLPDPKIEV